MAALVPGGLAIYLGFNAGGFFPGATAIAAVVLAGILIAAVTLSANPLAGLNRPLFVVMAAMGSLCAWTLASALWSGAPARALLEFDRCLLYLLSLVAFGLLVPPGASVRWLVRGLAVASLVVCGAGLVTRLLPGAWHVALDPIAEGRLSFPVSYWNALGLLAGLGIVLCAAITTNGREGRLARVLSAGAIPVLTTSLYFTFSRGALLATLVGLVALLIVGRPSAFVGGAGAAVPAAALAVGVALGADRLASAHPSGDLAVGQGHRVAAVVVLASVVAAAARALLLRVDDSFSVHLGVGAKRAGAAALAILALAAVVALSVLGTGGWLDRQRDRLLDAGGIHHTDQRQRLVDLGNNGRGDAWRVGVDAFRSSPLTGKGAGTYENLWSRQRPAPFDLVDAHSLYIESLAELGVPGLALILTAVVGILAALARRCRGPDRALYAGLFAAALAWALHAGLDWDWEMPVLSAWVFAAGGVALAADRSRESSVAAPRRLTRVVAGLALVVVAATPVSIAISQSRLDTGVRAFQRGDCRTATDQALGSSSVLSVRPEPFELLAYCDARRGAGRLATRMIGQAISRDPDNWELRYGQAVVLASGGRDPRPALNSAVRLDPLEPLLRSALGETRPHAPADRHSQWRRWARSARLPV